ncbi:MAG: YfcE family phosphodiesterase [Clostridia bacterium]|nr:YfcE family phosphodiesterase [Clostridia bacterium]
MKFLVISDSHRKVDHIKEAVERTAPIDAILYLGDGTYDFDNTERYNGIPLFCVKGNCDFFAGEKSLPDELILNFDEYNIMMMHGDLFDVTPNNFEKAAAHAAKKGADVLLFGHTHFPVEKYLPEGTLLLGEPLEKPLYVFNPGCLGRIAEGVGGHYYFGTMKTIEARGGIVFGHGTI